MIFSLAAVVFLALVAMKRHSQPEPSRPPRRLDKSTATTGFRVARVIDGDTVELIGGDEIGLVFRLRGVDAPERNQPFGPEARQLLEQLLQAPLDVRDIERGSFNRYEATIWASGKAVSAQLVTAGLAWCGRGEYFDVHLCQVEATARAEKRGLWSDPTPIAPWEWRAARRD